ncbi:MAG: aminomethyl-transferring glycine dehydrogenase subunit GcvPA [Thermoplasmatota archaeon]
MHLIPNHALEAEMARASGVASAQELFGDIPKSLRLGRLDLPPAEPERQLVRRLRATLNRNQSYERLAIFLGGASKPQAVPAAVAAVAHRQEFITSYTPYQPEVSQGLLQALFEYQSLLSDITGMEVTNAGMYDGPTALGEAALMCMRVTGRTRLLVPEASAWESRSIVHNYGAGQGLKMETYGFDAKTGRANVADVEGRLGADVAGVVVENPNHLGVFETEAQQIGEAAHAAGALFVVAVDPTALGIMRPPGPMGADIVVGEASCFGGAPALGGPLLGLFSTTEKHVRKMPGRVIGATRDQAGKRGYVMTLQAREQHIRRSKATSNICSNEALLSIQAAVHLTMLGRTGLRTMGLQNLEAGAKLERALRAGGERRTFTGAFYNEVVTRGADPNELHERCLRNGVHAGLRLKRDVPALADALLWGSTPLHRDTEYEALERALRQPKVEVQGW